jgi:hypothetical protein
MQNDNKEKRPEENLIVLQEKSNANNKNRHSIDSNNSSTFYSPRNRAKTFHKMNRNIAALYKLTFIDFNSIDLERTSEKKKTRIDNFGREIKKGGKQKIVFADELHLVKTIEEGKNKKQDKNENNKKRRNSYPKNKNKKAKDETYKTIKRSNSFDLCKRYLKNHNIDNFCYNQKKPEKFNNLDIIDFESTKKENKLNTYFFKKNIVVPDEDNVCCSCYCSIF